MPNTNESDQILVIGDEAKSARAVARLLQSAGYRTAVVDTFQAASATLADGKTALIVVEISASKISGPYSQPSEDDSGQSLKRQNWANEALAFCRGVRSHGTTAELPILVISRNQRPQDKVAALNAGASDYLIKPYQKGELLSRVKVHLRSWRYERDIAKKVEELNVLHSVSSVLASSLEPEILISGTLSALVNKAGAEAAVVFTVDRSGGKLAWAEGVQLERDDRNCLLGIISQLMPQTGSGPAILDPLPADVLKTLQRCSSLEVKRLLLAPLALKADRSGGICLIGFSDSPFPEPLGALLSTTCDQLSIALENCRLYIETRKSASQLSFVYNLSNNLMTTLEMDELLGYAVFTVGKTIESDLCAVAVRTVDEPPQLASAVYRRNQSGIGGTTAEWCHIPRVNRYLEGVGGVPRISSESDPSLRLLKDPAIWEEVRIPLMFDDLPLGVLICASYSRRSLTEDETRLLSAVGQQLSLAIRNTELLQRSKHTSINLAVEVARRTSEIEEQKRFTEKIIDSLPVSLYVVDRDMRIVAWNRNRELGDSGLSRGEVLGRNVFKVFSRQPRRMLEQEFTDVFRTGDLVNLEQESWVEGVKKYWRISKIPMRVDNAEVTHVITVGEDITEQKKMNDAVIHAEKLASIGRLAAGVVHELNNPLATIAACTEALTARVPSIHDEELNRDFAEYLGIMREEAFRCKTINNSLLDFSHQRQAEKMPGDINQLIDQTLQLTRHHPKLGKMRILKDLDASLAPVYVNEGQMKQIFIALISNACDAMENGGTLTIRTRWHDSDANRAVCAEFEDSGCGIPASHISKIFDPFFTTKPLGRGTGLGLSVCYGIVSEHGGKIEVDSAIGQGSTFRVLLPVNSDVQADTIMENIS